MPRLDMSRRVVSLLFLLAFALLPAAAAAADEPIVLTVGMQDWSDTYGRQVFLEQIVPAFEAAHPGVKVEIQWIDWGTYGSQYKVRYAGGVMPDVVSIGSAGLGEFAAAGMIQPIDHFLETWPGLSDMVPASMQDGLYEGKIYSVPYRLDVRTLLYNKRIFAEAGLPDAPPEAWEELTQYARRTTRRDAEGNITGQGFDVRPDVQHVLPFVFQAGGKIVSEDGRRALIAEDPVVEAVEFLHSLIYEHQVALVRGGSFVQGQNAMMYDGSWVMVQNLNPSFDDMGIALPTRHRHQTTQVHINKFAISSTTQHPELAWEWITFVLEPENLALINKESPRLTPRISSLEYEPFSTDPRWNTWMQAASLSTTLPGYVPTLSAILGQSLNQALQDILNNRAPARTRLEEAAREIEAKHLNW
ncbi:MAG: ABC transporter substrate-binding protein [Firmicutes bacterium]|nr:ABC transporter substrate-binding protein [Bacillota bacterium]